VSLGTRALLLAEDLTMSIGEREMPAPRPGEALIRVEWAGLCGSDLHVIRTGDWVASWPATLGHEIFGHVARAGEGVAVALGTPVVVDSRVPCAACAACATGDEDRCEHPAFVGEALPGGFATHCVVPGRNLHMIPESLDGAIAVLAEPLAVVLHALDQLDRVPERVALLGHGPIGALGHIELRRRHPATQIDVAEPAALRADLAQALGATTAPSAAELPGGYDVVVDAAGHPTALLDAIGLAAPGARLLLIGLGGHETAVRPQELVEKRLSIVGSNAFVSELPAAIALLAAEGWRYAPVVTHAISLAELPAMARRQLEWPDAIKVLVRP
jgi:threonine dehydrogenase-like Zn-dependent dehydrogenase